MQTVGQFNQDHPDVLGHREKHLAKILRLLFLASAFLKPVQLGDAVD